MKMLNNPFAASATIVKLYPSGQIGKIGMLLISDSSTNYTPVGMLLDTSDTTDCAFLSNVCEAYGSPNDLQDLIGQEVRIIAAFSAQNEASGYKLLALAKPSKFGPAKLDTYYPLVSGGKILPGQQMVEWLADEQQLLNIAQKNTLLRQMER